MPTVSVVVPTFNRVGSLRRTLQGLAGQVGFDGAPLDGFEVVVVSDGSTDGTAAYLRSAEVPLPVVAIDQPNAGPAAARNRAIEAATGDLLLFIDDDVWPTEQLIAEHLRRHDHPDDDLVVMGPMLTPPDHPMSRWVSWEQAMLVKQYDSMANGEWAPTARQFFTGNASVARRHVLAAGCFDPAFRRAEDVELAYRLADRGLGFAFDPEAVVLHYAERSFAAWLGAAEAYGRNDVVFDRDHGQRWLIDTVSEEFQSRHILVRAATRLCLPRPRLAAAVLAGGGFVARRAPRRLARPILSVVYNLAYYRGMAAELGGAPALLRRFDQARRAQ